MRLEIRGRCPACKTERCVWGHIVDDPTPAAMDAIEKTIDARGSVDAHCPRCDSVEEVAFFADGKQTEPWTEANEYERRNGPDAGPLPPKPWEKK